MQSQASQQGLPAKALHLPIALDHEGILKDNAGKTRQVARKRLQKATSILAGPQHVQSPL